MITPPRSTSAFFRYVSPTESTVITGAIAVLRNSDIHPKLCHKIGGWELNEANFKQSRTANREKCIPKTEPARY